jgi:hypothetical protein
MLSQSLSFSAATTGRVVPDGSDRLADLPHVSSCGVVISRLERLAPLCHGVAQPAAGRVAEPAEGTDAYFQEARGDLARLALQRQSSAEEQASAVAFLASDDASYVTGQTINCFGDP